MTLTFVFTYFLVTLTSAGVCFVILRQLNQDLGSEQEMRAFRSYLIGILWFILSNTIWVWINYGYLQIPGWPFSMANLIAICVASYYWFKYIELRLNPELVATTAFRLISTIPLYVAVFLVVTTPFTHLVFYYTETNEYIHGPLYSTMAILAILYLLVASVHIGLQLSKFTSPTQRQHYRVLMLFLVFPVAGGIIDIVIPNLPIMELMLMLSTVLVYTNMQQSQINTDILTGLNNRRLTDEYLLEQIAQASEDNAVYFFIGDADNFKEINDSYGHAEGDRALKLVAQAMKTEAADLPCHLARWGGDEFVIIVQERHIESPTALTTAIHEQIQKLIKEEELPYTLSVSHGYTRITSPNTTPQEVLDRADAQMYAMKERAHAKMHA